MFWNRRKSGKSIYHHILDPTHMRYRTGELSQVSQVALLTADQGGETLSKARVRGLWSVKIVNALPSKRKRKCWREE